MRFSVRAQRQNASFRRMHFSSPGQTWRRLTKKRSLHVEHNGKAQSVVVASPKGAVCSPQVGQNALFRESKLKPRSADPGTTRPAGWRGVARAHLPSWAIFHSAPQPGERLPRTSRAPQRDGKAHSAQTASRKSTFWRWPLTEKCTLCGRRDGRGTLFVGPHAKAHSACGQPPRVRLSVRVCSQSALFRRMRLFSPGQMSRCLTQKRTLRRRSHGKAPSGSPPYPLRPDVSRKDAL